MIVYSIGSKHPKFRDNTLLAALATKMETLTIGGEFFIDHAENVKGDAVTRDHLRNAVYMASKKIGIRVVTCQFDLHGLWVKAV